MRFVDFKYKILQPTQPLYGFVHSFWKLTNHSTEEKVVTIVPDGCFDLFFSISATEPFHVSLSGLGTQPEQAFIAPQMVTFAISFWLPAAEYIFTTSIAALLNKACYLPTDFWGMEQPELDDFELCCSKVSAKMLNLLPENSDNRKMELFHLLYATDGAASVEALCKKIYWSRRQVNRYFQQWFGLSLKAYCNILRYRASFQQLKEGKLFPEQAFADQAHFIKAVKRYSGVTPKEITKNKNGRFIQFSLVTGK